MSNTLFTVGYTVHILHSMQKVAIMQVAILLCKTDFKMLNRCQEDKTNHHVNRITVRVNGELSSLVLNIKKKAILFKAKFE